MMQPGAILAPEDKWAEGARKENYDYMSGMMGDVQAGRDPMAARREKQLQHQLGGIRRDMFGTPGDRNQSISGMGQQQMAMMGSNPAAMAAQRRKNRTYMQTQMDDVGDAGTDYMEEASFFAPEMMNKLRAGQETVGSYGPQQIPGTEPGGMDMEGIAGMVGAGVKGFGALKGGFNKWNTGRLRKKGGAAGREGPMMESGMFETGGNQGAFGTISEGGNPMSGYFQ
jgi:hypothetical protein